MQLTLFQTEHSPSPEEAKPTPPAPRLVRRLEKSENSFLRGIWRQLRREWFPERPDIDFYKLHWSTRKQKLTLASCNLDTKRILVARELNHRPFWVWLEPLLYHEMCHAYLNSEYHNRAFYRVEQLHPRIPSFDRWIDSGGWNSAVRSDRARRAQKNQVEELPPLFRAQA